MDSNQVTISILAKDGTSQAFRSISTAARGTATDLEAIGKKAEPGLAGTAKAADAASRSLDKTGKAAADAGRDLAKAGDSAKKAGDGFSKAEQGAHKLERNLTSAGAALGAVVGGFAKAGQAAQNHNRQLMALEKAYGQAADRIIAFGQQMKEGTNFALADIQEASRIAATLFQNYDMPIEQIEELIKRSADLATVTGISLADAVQRTTSAIRGEAESAEYLGLTMNQAAIDAEGLTLTMSNAEAAQFRFAEFTEQAAFAMGAAQERATGFQGAISGVADKLDAGLVALGNFGGGLLQLAAPLSQVALAMPVVGAAVAQAAPAVLRLSRAIGALVIGFGPLGLLVGGVAAAIGILIGKHREAEAAAQAQADALTNLETAIQGITDAVARQDLRDAAIQVEEYMGTFDQARVDAMTDALLEQTAAQQGSMNALGEATMAAQDYVLSAEDIVAVNTLLAEIAQAAGDDIVAVAEGTRNLGDAHEEGALKGELFLGSLQAISDALEYTGPGAEKYRELVLDVFTDLESQSISAETAAERVGILTANQVRYGESLEANKQSIHDYAQMEQDANAARERGVSATDALASAQDRLGTSTATTTQEQMRFDAALEGMDAAQARADEIGRYQTELGLTNQSLRMTAQAHRIERDELIASLGATGRYSAGLQEAALAAYEAAGGAGDHKAAMEAARTAADAYREASAALVGTLRESAGITDVSVDESGIVQLSGSYEDLAAAMGVSADSAAELFNLLYQTDFSGVAAEVEAAGAALDQILGQYAQLDALGQRSTQAGSIASNLIGEPGELAEIDNMLAQGVITQEQYNQAVQDGTAIAQTDAAIQSDLNRIRADRLGLLASEQASYATTIDKLANLTSTEFEHAAALLDTEQAAKLAAVQSALYAATLGDIPAEQATQLTLDAANADAELAGLLEAFGIIEQTAEGGWQLAIEIAGGEDAKKTVGDIVSSVDRLNNTVAEVGFAITGDEDLLDLKTEVEGLDGEQVDITVAARSAQGGPAEAPLGIVKADVAELDGTEANVTVAVDGDTSEVDAAVGEYDGKTVGHATIEVTPELVKAADYDASGLYQGGAATQEVPVRLTLDSSAVDSWTPPRYDPITVMLAAQVDDASFSSAQGAAAEWDNATYTATFGADIEEVVNAVVGVTTEGTIWGISTFTAVLSATDSASMVVAGAATNASNFAATPYTATLSASDAASTVVGAAQSAATAFATDYSATLNAVDNASGTISAVDLAVSNLNGKTATVYVNVQQNAPVPGMALGGVVAEHPHAANGRIITVGEAGEENVYLPFGAMVTPHGASRAANQVVAAKQAVAPQAAAPVAAAPVAAPVVAPAPVAPPPAPVAQAAARPAPPPPPPPESTAPARPAPDVTVGTPVVSRPDAAPGKVPVNWKQVDTAKEARSIMDSTGDEGQWKKAVDHLVAIQRETRLERVERSKTQEVKLRGHLADMQQAAKRKELSTAQKKAIQDEIAATKEAIATQREMRDLMQTMNKTPAGSDRHEAAKRELVEVRAEWDKLQDKIDSAQSRYETATGKMEQDVAAVGESAQASGEQVGSSFEKGAGTAERAIDQALSAIGSKAQETGAAVSDALGSIGGDKETAGNITEIGEGLADVAGAINDIPTGKKLDALTEGTGELVGQMASLGDMEVDPTLGLDAKQFHKELSATIRAGEALGDKVFVPDVSANKAAFDRIYADVVAGIDALNATKSTVGIDGNAAKFNADVAAIDGSQVGIAYIELEPSDTDGDAPAPSGQGKGNALGGFQAAGGGWVGESGPEWVDLPPGSFITPNGASRSRGGGGGNLIVNGGIFHIYTPDADVARAVQVAVMTEARG